VDLPERDLQPLTSGEVVADRYRILQPLAEGGKAVLWLAHHVVLRTQVVLKLPKGGLNADVASSFLRRFRFEAQVSAELATRTPHIVTVHDAGQSAIGPYLVMEYVRGKSLDRELLMYDALAPERVADVIEQVAHALTVAHAAGIVHRDLKPSNVLVENREDRPFVKVCDFGLAKRLGPGLEVDDPPQTSVAFTVGSPPYMSPEQLRGKTTPFTDLWGLAVLAYELLTNEPAFRGTNLAGLMEAICEARFTKPASMRPELPVAVNAWFARSFARRPEERFGSPREAARALRESLGLTVS
jgi:serine/threonine-protein kinase